MNNIHILLMFCLFTFLSILPACEKKEPPTILTDEIEDITGTTATSGGIIIDEGSSAIIARGVCWSIDSDPTIEDDKTSDGTGGGVFSSSLTGLTGATNYYVRAYATNSEGTGYGTDMSFTTLGALPGISTLDASEITTTSATLNGTVNANYLSTIVSFEYGTTESYGQTVTAAQSPVLGNANADVSVEITDLSPSTTYHFRVKAVNDVGTSYGDDMTCSTLGQVPLATTQEATDITVSEATLHGIVNANLLSTSVTFEYGVTTDYGNVIHAVPETITGDIDVEINAVVSNLEAGTTYHFRVKAVNSLGTTYGEDFSFQTQLCMFCRLITYESNNIIDEGLETEYCGAALESVLNKPTVVIGNLTMIWQCTFGAYSEKISDIDGNEYTTILIGSQIWTKDNLKVTKFNDGTSINNITENTEWSSLTSPGYSWYNNDEIIYKNPYGALYNGYAVITGKLCPIGWHIPSRTEWSTLITFLGGFIEGTGGKMKETGTFHWKSPNTGATNISGFTGLPGGSRDYYLGSFGWGSSTVDQYGFWWTSSTDLPQTLWYHSLHYWDSYIGGSASSLKSGFSVRCIKD